jgi:hypothetical protein
MIKPKYKIPMRFQDGDFGKKMKPEFSGKTTIDLIIEGHRTGTSRDVKKDYNQYELKIGDIILFYSGGKNVLVEITKEPYPIKSITPKEWSDYECWDENVYFKLNKNYKQFTFKLYKSNE